jgi:hypothetical protein
MALTYPGDPGPDISPFIDTRIYDEHEMRIVASIAAPIWPTVGSTVVLMDPIREATVKQVVLQFEFEKPGAFIAIRVDTSDTATPAVG